MTSRFIVLAAAASGLIALQGCASDGIDSDTTEAFNQGLSCTTNGGIDPTKAALAVAMAEELGQLDPVKQLEIVNGKVALKAGVCAPGKCPKTQALLGFQDTETNNYIPQAVFNATSYRNDLVSSIQRQKDWEWNLQQNNPAALPDAHSLVFVQTTDLGACGVHSVFNAFMPGCKASVAAADAPAVNVQYKATNTNPTDNVAGFYYKVTAGATALNLSAINIRYKMIKEGSASLVADCYYGSKGCPTYTFGNGFLDMKLSGTLAANQVAEVQMAVHLSDWAPMDERNDDSYMPTMTSYGVNPLFGSVDADVAAASTATCTPFAQVTDLENRMKFFGDNNPFLDVRTDGNQIWIDPDLGDTGNTGVSSGICETTALCRVYDPQWLKVTGCCVCSGVQGTWQVYPRNNSYVYCKAN